MCEYLIVTSNMKVTSFMFEVTVFTHSYVIVTAACPIPSTYQNCQVHHINHRLAVFQSVLLERKILFAAHINHLGANSGNVNTL